MFISEKQNMKHLTLLAVPLLIAALSALPAGCRKGGDETVVTGAPTLAWGVMKKGSVVVNDVTFDATRAQIEHNDSPAGSALLQEGMNVKVRGRLNSDGVTGTAEKIKAECELQGTISALGADSITLVGQQVFIDSRTVYANAANLQGLAPGQWVEVYGMRDHLDRLLATRIEVRLTSSGPASDRLKGRAEAPFTGGNPPALLFMLRGLTVVTTAGTLIQPEGSAINPGDSVEVHGFLSGTTFTAGRIDREDLEESDYEPRDNDHYKGDGFISGFTGPAADFLVNGHVVRLSSATEFDGGDAADLANNIRVIVEGLSSGGVLLAGKLRFDDSETVRIEANADAAGKADLLGKTVVSTGLTELHNLTGGVAGIAAGQGLKLRGFLNPDGGITARQLEGLGQPVDPAKVLLQGRLESADASSRSLVVLGVTVTAPGADDGFFSQLTPNRSIVEARGAFSAGPPPLLTADQIEAK